MGSLVLVMLRLIVGVMALLASFYFVTERAVYRLKQNPCMARRSTRDRLCFLGLWLADILIAGSFILALTLAF